MGFSHQFRGTRMSLTCPSLGKNFGSSSPKSRPSLGSSTRIPSQNLLFPIYFPFPLPQSTSSDLRTPEVFRGYKIPKIGAGFDFPAQHSHTGYSRKESGQGVPRPPLSPKFSFNSTRDNLACSHKISGKGWEWGSLVGPAEGLPKFLPPWGQNPADSGFFTQSRAPKNKTNSSFFHFEVPVGSLGESGPRDEIPA